MSNRKFFTGLPPAMMSRPSAGPNRQQTNFFWPDEAACQPSSRNRMRNRSMSTASISQSQASTDTEESRKRRFKDMHSRIEFYDMVDTTDTESNYNRKLDPTTHKKLEGLKSRIEFYDYTDSSQAVRNMENEDADSVIEVIKNKQEEPKASVDQEIAKSMNNLSIHKKPPKQQQPQYDSESEEEMYRYPKPFRNHVDPQKYYRRPQQQQPHPRRYHSHYFDDFEDDGYERYYESNRRPRLPRTARRAYSPDDISDEEFYDDRSYATSRRNTRNRDLRSTSSRYGDYEDQPQNSRLNGHVNETDTIVRTQNESQPPVKPVSRAMSMSESRRRHHVNLKSNIFHNDNEYEQVVGQRKPLSVRDFAANHRVGVGLPDLD